MTQPLIPILDLQPQIQTHWTAFQSAFERVMKSGHFIQGPEVQSFERELSSYFKGHHAVTLNSGTDALYIALRCLGIGPGDEVITTPFTFFATAEAISHVGATPVFVDVEADSYNLDSALVKAAVTPRTKAIIPVHLFGRPCAMDILLEVAADHGLAIVEDCAQSFGSTWLGHQTGTLGTIGCFSFFPSKNLGTFGDGGMLLTSDSGVAEQARMLRAHGSKKKYYNETVGYNSRLDELQAALLRVKLPFLDVWNEGRRRVAGLYAEALAGVPGVIVPEVAPGDCFHQYTVRILGGQREAVKDKLAEQGIGTMVYYPVPVHRLKIYQQSHAATKCPVAERLATEVLSLPIWPEMDESTLRHVACCLKDAL